MNGQHEALLAVIRKIADRYLPGERSLLDIEGPIIVSGVLDSRSGRRQKEEADEFRFGAQEVVEGIKMVALLLGTAKTVRDLLQTSKKPGSTLAIQEIGARWQKKLVSEGMEELLAAKIVKDFESDLSSLVSPKP
jgi:hypothetical protein